MSGAVDWMPAETDSPEAPFELRAYDARGAYTRQLWMVDVADVNTPPVLAPIADQTIREGDLLEIQAGAFDSDGDPLVFWADNLPPGATFDAATNTLRWRPDGLAAGRYSNVQIFASDGMAESFVSFEIVVTNRNQPPVLDQPADRSLREGDTLAIALHATDVDGDAIRILAPNLPPGAFIHPITGIFTWTPRFDQHGDYDIDIAASDGQARTTRTLHVEVTNVNGAIEFPRLDRFEIFEGQPIMVRVAANDPEVPGLVTSPLAVSEDFFVDAGGLPPITYEHTPLPPGASYDLAKQLFTWIPSFQQAGNYVITFMATDDGDGTGTSTSDSVTLETEVMNLNGVPVVDAIANQELNVSAMLDIPVRATDPDPGAPGLVLSVVGLPGFATFTDNGDGTGLIHAAPQPGQRGNYTIAVRATDAGGGNPLDVQIGQVQFVLSVKSDNEPPMLEPIGGKVAIIGEEIFFQVQVADADQDDLTFSATRSCRPTYMVSPSSAGRRRWLTRGRTRSRSWSKIRATATRRICCRTVRQFRSSCDRRTPPRNSNRSARGLGRKVNFSRSRSMRPIPTATH
jgi:hypothetical protein